MKRDLYVLDAIIPLHIFGSMEEAVLYNNCICEKIKVNKNDYIYKDICNNKFYYVTDSIGYCRVKPGSVRSLKLYYNFLGLPKVVNRMEDGKKVRNKVRSLIKRK